RTLPLKRMEPLPATRPESPEATVKADSAEKVESIEKPAESSRVPEQTAAPRAGALARLRDRFRAITHLTKPAPKSETKIELDQDAQPAPQAAPPSESVAAQD